MKNYIIIILLLCTSSSLWSQQLPPNFKETVNKEYQSISGKDHGHDHGFELNSDEYYQLRKEEYISYKNFLKGVAGTKSVSNLCDNGTFESGDVNMGDWNFYWYGGASTGGTSGTTRLNSGIFTGSSTPPINQVHHQVQGIGADDFVASLNKVYSYPSGNTKSLRLGNAHVKWGKESVAKKVIITPSNSDLSFSYAIVMHDPSGHSTAIKPYFSVKIIDASTLTDYSSLVDLGGGSNTLVSNHPLLTPLPPSGSIVYKNWACLTVDLSSLIGKEVIITFETRDCWAGGHMGYAYLDNLCLGCENAPSDEGTVTLNTTLSDSCDIPGQICVDYTLPVGSGGAADLTLELIQNGVVITTLTSPTLTSGSTYCFSLTGVNTAALNTIPGGFDYKVIGSFSLPGFALSPKTIGNSATGVTPGINNDYEFDCPRPINCCQTPLNISHDGQALNTVTNVPAGAPWSGGVPLSMGSLTFTINQNSAIPITELRTVVTDVVFEYNYATCAVCVDNPSLWGSIDNADLVKIGDPVSGLAHTDYAGIIQSDFVNQKEVIWRNPNGTMLHVGDSFKLTYAFPPVSEIPCCVTTVKVCIEISWKDANCNVCSEYVCAEFNLTSGNGN
ncbi:hypothetical protein N9933_00885 [bacterium]|nr:hypothetical protein [bacterium]